MKKTLALGLLLVALSFAARPASPVLLADLSHGENAHGLCAFMKTMPETHWIVLVPQEDYQLPPCSIVPEVIVGNFASKEVVEALKKVDGVIIGQPTKTFSEDELKAIADWFKGGQKLLWCAGDSDYPAQGGVMEIAQHACNDVFEAIGSKLRLDYVSVEDTVSNAGRPYRVIGIVNPSGAYDSYLVGLGAHKVLFHGPGAVAWVDENETWHKLTDELPNDVVVLVTTTENGRIVEHQPTKPGAPGDFGQAHTVGETGKFVLMAAQVMGDKAPYSVVIASGESPYGGYQPMVSFRYHGLALDGPRFVRNVFLWGLDYKAELGSMLDLSNLTVNNVASKVNQQLSAYNTMIQASIALAVLAIALAVILHFI
ncbi:aminotransferase [Ignicoccus islandicus DSM 13165]|uniref:Aminotransferase n=1 Tax=Ignicoccus islandicus DSM 13165 TaxID=940295 RepID=A0A0U3FNC1_9CREN|nr:DUF2059 domain-containing protein [Ignicoccus islandicus]ALU11839.1 aminotransferase [Ignicoccus islandicus DSM 13165]